MASELGVIPSSSHGTVSTKEQLESALANFADDTDQSSTGGHISEEGKKIQMLKMLTLIITPIAALLSVSLYFMADNIQNKAESAKVRDSVQFSTELGQLIHIIQMERDMSVLYLSSIGPETKSFLTSRYLDTDEFLEDLSYWPVDIDMQRREYFRTKRDFRRHLSKHRSELSPEDNIYFEVQFYSDLIVVLIRWIYDAIRESRFGTVWKSLVAYQKVVSAKEELGIQRALGIAYFSRGEFINIEGYYLYLNKRTLYRANIRSALLYAPFLLIDTEDSGDGLQLLPMLLSNDASDNSPLSPFRQQILNREATVPSVNNATRFYDIMSELIGEHLTVQRAIAKRVLSLLDGRTLTMTSGVALSSIIILCVLIMCPILVRTVQRLTDSIQRYAMTLSKKTHELKLEKKRTDSLLYQMLPKPVADKLKRRSTVDAEFFKEVTIFFSDILGFGCLIRDSPPMDIVSVLNTIYTIFDTRIGLYDVYKVETIGDSYMIASGLPQRNGSQHASEIANISLDLLETCRKMEVKKMPQGRLNIRIGIHSGQCVAGVVGLKLPRYCLFGDSVNTASRMETTGLSNHIHISASTNRFLKRTGQYVIKERGCIEVKGKGMMTTFFLIGRNTSPKMSCLESGYDEGRTSQVENTTELEDESNETGERVRDTHTASALTASALTASALTASALTASALTTSALTEVSAEEGKVDDKGITEETCNPESHSKIECKDSEIDQVPEISGASSGLPTSLSAPGCAPPSYKDLEEVLEAGTGGSPPIFNLVEGYHF